MKTKKKYLSLLMALLMCIGIFSGCSGTSDTYDEDDPGTSANTNDELDESVQAEDVLGEVTYVGTSYLSLTTYESASEITDYAAVDVSSLTEVGGMEYVYPDANAEYYKVSSAMLVSASYEDLAAGCMIAVTTGSDGTQQIIILEEAAAENLTDDTATEETEDDGEMLPVDTYVVAEVTAVNEDGSLTLLNYVSIEDALEYTIEDYFAADLTQFDSDGTYSDYTIPEDAIIYLVETSEDPELTEDGIADEITADYIIVSDMLVIYTDDFGVTNIVVYPAEAETEVTE